MLISIIRLSSCGDYRENNPGDGKVPAKMTQQVKQTGAARTFSAHCSIAMGRFDVVVCRLGIRLLLAADRRDVRLLRRYQLILASLQSVEATSK
ncbi:hypothetical protein [Mesorhizobium sp. M0130]